MPETPKGLAAVLRGEDNIQDNPTARRVAKDTVLRFFKALAMKDMVALGEVVADDVIYELPFSESGSTEPGRYRRYAGRAAVVAFWQETSGAGIKALPPEDVELSVLPDGSRLFIEQRGNLTMPDGKIYRNRYVFRFDLLDGRVGHVREYINPIISAYAFGRKLGDDLPPV